MIFCLFSSFLSRCGIPSDTRWCNTSKEIYILIRCWSQTSCYGAARFVQSWVNLLTCFDLAHTGHAYSAVNILLLNLIDVISVGGGALSVYGLPKNVHVVPVIPLYI